MESWEKQIGCKNAMQQVYMLKVKKLQGCVSCQEIQRMLHKQDLKQTRQLLKICYHHSVTVKKFVNCTLIFCLRTYLSTFVEGMENNVDENNFIHPEFMQCITATGRLSSRNPNFQNMPRGSTFRIRKVVESRFEGGSIIEGDYSQLEFRVAGFLANDSQIYKDVEDGVDVHAYTASVIGCDNRLLKLIRSNHCMVV